MEDDILSSALRVSDQRAATVFLKPHLRAMLACLAEPRHATDVASECEIPLNLTCYHLSRLVSLGLVDQLGTRKRPGRPMKQYRAKAKAFFIPAEFAGRTLGSQLNDELRDLLSRTDNHREGELFFVDHRGKMHARKLPGEGARAAVDGLEIWIETRISPDRVSSFACELRNLISSYRNDKGQGTRYLFHAALAKRR